MLRFKLKVSSKNGKDNTEITNYFRLVAFDNISQKLPELCEGELVEVVGFIKNVKYQKDGKNYYDYDFVIDELRKVV